MVGDGIVNTILSLEGLETPRVKRKGEFLSVYHAIIGLGGVSHAACQLQNVGRLFDSDSRRRRYDDLRYESVSSLVLSPMGEDFEVSQDVLKTLHIPNAYFRTERASVLRIV